ncbi:relaxase domain-containing protein [Kribbella antiqua]|uniref:relaxase domain-containing protein n=1 Tax=Kribbella antiqua TaxID=2512217 RepID=UPI001305110C|nr:relaxase domain-containing protein [Kribbella antiqua]
MVAAGGWARRRSPLCERGSRRNPAFEIDAIPDELIREFSARSAQIEANLNALLDDRIDQIHPPGRREMYACGSKQP